MKVNSLLLLYKVKLNFMNVNNEVQAIVSMKKGVLFSSHNLRNITANVMGTEEINSIESL